ncbi:MAG: hypothetical protein HN392_08620 [Anaerolineae bacterium]|jgi:hypothetical protein|nr:hypothetical protein [Anaerolineae bacterium]MBT7073846.1 hypothetical protein [Anaerolineae bacterium]MBT7783098.1 hypothetical protein [Anaerolineae bacterium]
MLDNLREEANSDSFFDDEIPDFLDDLEENEDGKTKAESPAFFIAIKKMSSVQRFVISAMFFMLVCLIGSMVLLVTGKFSVF